MLTCPHESAICVKTKSTKEREGYKLIAIFEKLGLTQNSALRSLPVLFCLDTKKNEKNQARTLPLYPLLAALQPRLPEWAVQISIGIRARPRAAQSKLLIEGVLLSIF